ncbi:MAG TPA: c-type cytochrome [Rhodocyclaceae bacterium]|nr:c-type cytochrome [Rhodocyclaceae bacterium]
MQRVLLAAATALAFLCNPAAADSPEAVAQRIGQGNPVAGKEKSRVEVCQECHGEDGNSEEAKFPKLTGQHAAYIVKQIHDFQTGARKHEIMTGMASAIREADLVDIAAWFASNRPMQGEAPRDNPVGKKLFANGDGARGILPCASCHGAEGKGAATAGGVYPAIGGQHRDYLRAQLLDWRIGGRKNSPGGIMNSVAKALTDDEVRALVEYVSGL